MIDAAVNRQIPQRAPNRGARLRSLSACTGVLFAGAPAAAAGFYFGTTPLLIEPSGFGCSGGLGFLAHLGLDLRLHDQLAQTTKGFGAIAFLPPFGVSAEVDLAGRGHAFSRQRLEPLHGAPGQA